MHASATRHADASTARCDIAPPMRESELKEISGRRRTYKKNIK